MSLTVRPTAHEVRANTSAAMQILRHSQVAITMGIYSGSRQPRSRALSIACATGRQPGEVVEGDVPDDFDDELGREFGGGVV